MAKQDQGKESTTNAARAAADELGVLCPQTGQIVMVDRPSAKGKAEGQEFTATLRSTNPRHSWAQKFKVVNGVAMPV